MPNNTIFIHALNILHGIGPKSFEKLEHYFQGNLEAAWRASEKELTSAGISEETATTIVEKRKTVDPEEAFLHLEKNGIALITKDSDSYPVLLKEIPSKPAALYVRGMLSADEFSLAIVGTRKPTVYGKEACTHIASELVSANISVVSGLAFGIDGIAHQEAVNKKKRTIAVLGSGIDDASIYPQSHLRLARAIIQEGGALISEFPPQTPALPHHFPQRNRIVAGMTKGTIVVEAKEKSGALITARLALEYNRDVFAIPGPIFSLASIGPNTLIQEGAMLIKNSADILTAYNIEKQNRPPHISLNEAESAIFNLLESPLPLGIIRQNTAMETSVINATLSMLELKKLIVDIGNKTYVRKTINKNEYA